MILQTSTTGRGAQAVSIPRWSSKLPTWVGGVFKSVIVGGWFFGELQVSSVQNPTHQ